jgi:integrase
MPERKALPLDEFPTKYRLAINRLETPKRGRRRYSKASIKNTIQGFGQYLQAVRKAGLPLELSSQGLCIFIEDLDARPIKSSSRLSYMTAVQAIAKEVKYPAAERRLILEDCEIYRAETMLEVPNKVRKLTAHPISLRDVAQAAVKCRDAARKAKSDNRRRTYFQRSAVLALLSLVPLRISDANALILGQHVKRTEIGWSLTVSSSKSGYRHNGPLHHNLTRYIDDLLLFGRAGSVLHEYAQRMGTPLFGTETNDHLSARTLASGFKVAAGGYHSPHIVRTLTHDALAKHGTYGADVARVLCGQTSPQTAKSYEVYAARQRVGEAQKILTQIQAEILPRMDLH